MTEDATAQKLAKQCADFMYSSDKASQALGIQIEEIGPGSARLSMKVREDMANGQGNCHGGIIFALADSAFAFACNSYNRVTVAQGGNIDFVRPARAGDLLTAMAEEKSRGRSTGVVDVEVTRDDGKTVALFRGKSFSIDQALLP